MITPILLPIGDNSNKFNQQFYDGKVRKSN